MRLFIDACMQVEWIQTTLFDLKSNFDKQSYSIQLSDF